MILKRKMYDKLLTLKKELNGKKAFLIEGARRIGKSTICEEFGRNEYKSYILIDFAKCPDDVKDYFVKHMNDLDTFFMLLSTYYGVKLYERDSLIIFDEVQMYPKARECIKYLVADGRYDYIETGSLISIKENVNATSVCIPSILRSSAMLWARSRSSAISESALPTEFPLKPNCTIKQCFCSSNICLWAVCRKVLSLFLKAERTLTKQIQKSVISSLFIAVTL